MLLLYQNFVLNDQKKKKKKKKKGSITYMLRFKQVGFISFIILYHLFQVGLKISFNTISYT